MALSLSGTGIHDDMFGPRLMQVELIDWEGYDRPICLHVWHKQDFNPADDGQPDTDEDIIGGALEILNAGKTLCSMCGLDIEDEDANTPYPERQISSI